MKKFIEWFKLNRRPIGYVAGGLSAVNGLLYLTQGDMAYGIFGVVIGAFLIYDAKVYK